MTEPAETPVDDANGGANGAAAPGRAAQLFDLRTVIAVLFGVYGVVLTLRGAFATNSAELAKAGGININLWSGIAMLVLAGLFVAWVVLRPLAPPGSGR
jgi:drug/metabolite transporter (DMT)-like permease